MAVRVVKVSAELEIDRGKIRALNEVWLHSIVAEALILSQFSCRVSAKKTAIGRPDGGGRHVYVNGKH